MVEALEAAEGGVMPVVPINDVPVVAGGLVASPGEGWVSLTAIGPMLQGRDLSVNDWEVTVHWNVISSSDGSTVKVIAMKTASSPYINSDHV